VPIPASLRVVSLKGGTTMPLESSFTAAKRACIHAINLMQMRWIRWIRRARLQIFTA